MSELKRAAECFCDSKMDLDIAIHRKELAEQTFEMAGKELQDAELQIERARATYFGAEKLLKEAALLIGEGVK